jgi:hypothetical protein
MPTEDYTTYTEVDPNSHISKTASRITFTDLALNEDAYVYGDKGPDHFNGDYEHKVTVEIIAAQNNASVYIWTLANLVDDQKGIVDAGGDYHTSAFYLNSSGVRIIWLAELVGGTLYYDFYSQFSFNTPYYLRTKRDESIGVYGALICYVYTDFDETDLLATLSVALHEKEDFRYVYGVQSTNPNLTPAITGYAEDLDLQEASAAVIPPHVFQGAV